MKKEDFKNVIAPAIDIDYYINEDEDSEELILLDNAPVKTESTSVKKRIRSASPDQKPKSSKIKQEDEDDNQKTTKKELDAIQRKEDEDAMAAELDAISITKQEMELLHELNFEKISDLLTKREEVRFAKLFKLWRKVKDEKNGIFHNKDLNQQFPRRGLQQSWEQFIEYAREGEERISKEIEKRRGYKLRSLAWQRDNVHMSCVCDDIPCAVFLREGNCKNCQKDGIKQSEDVSWDTRRKGNDVVELQIQQYLRTLSGHQLRLAKDEKKRDERVKSPVETHTRSQHQERLQKEDSRESKYHDREESRSNEHDRHGYYSESAEHYGRYEYAHDQYDRSYRSRDEAYWESNPYDQRSSRRSNAYYHESRSRGDYPVGYSRNEDWNYQSIQTLLMSHQKHLSEGLQNATDKREELSHRLVGVERDQYRLTDKSHDHDKLIQRALLKSEKRKEEVKALQNDLKRANARIDKLETVVSGLIDQMKADRKEIVE